MFRVAVCDDEERQREQIKQMLLTLIRELQHLDEQIIEDHHSTERPGKMV
ncbi:hypothetical protein ACL02P_09045 [Paenibacillus sp. MB22_1]